MTLTKEQFEKLYEKGLTVEQIKAFESGETPETMKPDTFMQSLVKDPIKTLVAKPAVRFGQAVGVGIGKILGATPEQRDKALAQDVNIPTPFGNIKVEGQKKFGQGGAKQIVGDAAKTASYLYTGGTGGAVGRTALSGQIARGAGQGAKLGAIGGGLYSFGQAIQEAEAQAPEVAYKTLFGASIGAAFGLTLGVATPIVVKGANVARKFSNIGELNKELYRLNNTTLRPTPTQAQKWADMGVDPIKTYTEIFATDIPKVDKSNRFIPESTQEFAGRVDTLYKTGAEGFNTILRNSPETNSLAKLESDALARNSESGLTALQKQQAEIKIKGEFQALRREYSGTLIDGDRLPVYISDSIKDRYWGATKYFGPEEASVSNEANRAIARSFADGIDSVITDVNVRNYNKELQRLIVLRDYIDSLGGKLAGTGGKMTRLMSRIVGGVAGSGGGPVGTVLGSITGDKVAQVLMNPENSPMRWLILKKLESLPKAERQSIINEANDIIQQMLERKNQMLQLPAGAIPMGPETLKGSINVSPAARGPVGVDPQTGKFFGTFSSESAPQ